MRLRFLGADRQITGSRYLLELSDSKILVDCGLFQERPYLERNWDPFPVPPAEVDVLLLTHAHLDHSGYIPRLVKEGFGGKILATSASVDLAGIVLLDSANILEEDAAFKQKRHEKEGRKGPHPEIPLYTVEDARGALPLFEGVPYLRPVTIGDSASVRFFDAGHILGSSMLDLEIRENGTTRRIIFSGDIGQWDKPLLHDPTVFDAADFVVMESTYGDRNHEDPENVEDMLTGVINETVKRGGNIVIPVFAVERAQELMYHIHKLQSEDRIPHILVFLDSPMAAEVTRVFARYPQLLDGKIVASLLDRRTPFDFPGLKLLTTIEESKAVNRIKGSCVILAGSGMCTAGRIKHHLTQNIERSESTVLFVGYQAPYTLGRQILEGAPEVRINGKPYKVRSRIAQIQGFSGHAGRDDLLRWLSAFQSRPKRLFLTHGEEETSLALARSLEQGKHWAVTVPEYKEVVDLG